MKFKNTTQISHPTVIADFSKTHFLVTANLQWNTQKILTDKFAISICTRILLHSTLLDFSYLPNHRDQSLKDPSSRRWSTQYRKKHCVQPASNACTLLHQYWAQQLPCANACNCSDVWQQHCDRNNCKYALVSTILLVTMINPHTYLLQRLSVVV